MVEPLKQINTEHDFQKDPSTWDLICDTAMTILLSPVYKKRTKLGQLAFTLHFHSKHIT